MSAAGQLPGVVARPGAVASPPAALSRGDAPALAGRLGARLGNEWLPRAAWTIGRTGRPGLLGIALLLAAALFLLTTHLEVASEVEALRGDLATARARTRAPAKDEVADSLPARALPARADVPEILGQLFEKAARARLAVDSAKYGTSATGSAGVVRYQVAFPVKGPYPQIRAFIDATLATMPEVALNELVLERKSIGDGNVEAQIGMIVYARSAP